MLQMSHKKLKKFIAKILGFIALSLVLTATIQFSAFADENPGNIPIDSSSSQTAGGATELQSALNDVTSTPCIDEVGADKNYIITIIEEPLDIKDDERDPEFKYRTCHRVTFQYVDEDNKLQTLTELTRGCSDKAQNLAQQYADPPGPNGSGGYSARYSCQEVQVILSKGGTNMIYGYIGMIYKWGASLVGIIAVLNVVLNGIRLGAAGGDPEVVNSAKTKILQSLAGIAVLFLSGLILYTVNPTFFTNS